MFEKVSRSLKYDSKKNFEHKHNIIIPGHQDNHFIPLALRVRGNYQELEQEVDMDTFNFQLEAELLKQILR